MKALGSPYAPGTAGPESWDCGSLVQSVYGAAGISLPAYAGGPLRRHDAGRARRRAAGRPRVPRQRRGRARARGHRAGPEDDARRRRPGRRGRRAHAAGRPGAGHRPAEPGPAGAGGARPGRRAARCAMECGNTVYPPSYDGARQWGGYPNGLIPPSAMCPLGVAGHPLRCDAAAAYRAMSAAFAAAFGSPICITDSYRTYASQVRLYGEKPGARRGARHQQPRLGAGGGPLRRHRELRHRRRTTG